ncbi:MAG: ROK family protein, partial [Clostridia bacterium]|nr:ROK family protein [Clostridia bacterium]
MIRPKLDPNFYPMIKAIEDFDNAVAKVGAKQKKEITIVVERNGGYNYVYTYTGFADGVNDDLNYRMAERLAKTILWVCGGYKISIYGSKEIYTRLKDAYTKTGKRAFDEDFMSGVYEKPFEVTYIRCKKDIPEQKNASVKVGGFLKGCRIGFDAGGSDRKVSAVIDGEVVYSEEVVWNPKVTSDPTYHYNEILTAMKTAASK